MPPIAQTLAMSVTRGAACLDELTYTWCWLMCGLSDGVQAEACADRTAFQKHQRDLRTFSFGLSLQKVWLMGRRLITTEASFAVPAGMWNRRLYGLGRVWSCYPLMVDLFLRGKDAQAVHEDEPVGSVLFPFRSVCSRQENSSTLSWAWNVHGALFVSQ